MCISLSIESKMPELIHHVVSKEHALLRNVLPLICSCHRFCTGWQVTLLTLPSLPHPKMFWKERPSKRDASWEMTSKLFRNKTVPFQVFKWLTARVFPCAGFEAPTRSRCSREQCQSRSCIQRQTRPCEQRPQTALHPKKMYAKTLKPKRG